MKKNDHDDDDKRNSSARIDQLAEISARVSLSYIGLEMKDYASALDYAKQALAQGEQQIMLSTLDTAGRTLWQRQQATARMYASDFRRRHEQH